MVKAIAGAYVLGSGDAYALARADAHQEQLEPAQGELVVVLELAPVDALAVDPDAVQAAVVEHPDRLPLAVNERVAPRHGRVVEAHVRRKAAAQPGPALLQRDYPDPFAIVVREVVTTCHERLARLLQPFRPLDVLRAPAAGVGRGEHRRTGEALAVAARARRHDVALMKGDRVTAALAVE